MNDKPLRIVLILLVPLGIALVIADYDGEERLEIYRIN